jgi:integrase/recombinase XerD
MGRKVIIKKSDDAELINLFEAFNEFIIEKEAHNLSDFTINNYKRTFQIFTDYHGFNDETTTDDIKQSHIYKWINSLKTRVKPKSINHYIGDIRAFLYWCMDDSREYIIPSFKIELIKAQEEQIKLFSNDELEVLLEKPRKSDSFAEWRTWVIINWVLATGNRASTVCEVQIGDVDFKKREIVLRHTKNNKLQIIPLSSTLESVLKEYVRMWRKEADSSSYMFPTVSDEKMNPKTLEQSFYMYCRRKGTSKTSIHGLRHNFAKAWVQNGGNMYKLQMMLGHSSLGMTQRYVRLFGEDLKEDFDSFAALDSLKKKTNKKNVMKRNLD